jgi:AraC family transcriptional regulator
MRAQREKGGTADPAPGAEQNWLGNSLWQAPEVEISRIKSWASITAVSYRRAGGESVWRGDRHRIILTRDHIPPMLLQVEQGPTWQKPAAAPGALSFYPAGLTVRGVVKPGGRLIQVLWDTDVYSALLPELGAEASRFEFLVLLQDPLLAQIVFTLAQEVEGGFADRILVESLGTALCIRIARRFVRDLPLPTSKGLSPGRLQRVRDYIEAHLDEDLSLTVLADIACLSPYHFSRSFKEAVGAGPQRYVMERRLERAKTLMRRTNQPLALIAQEAGFSDQSHLTSIFRREMGVTPGRYRAAIA